MTDPDTVHKALKFPHLYNALSIRINERSQFNIAPSTGSFLEHIQGDGVTVFGGVTAKRSGSIAIDRI
jgi:hypothetical protein